MLATNIDWDTGNDMEIKEKLPKQVKVPDYVRYDFESIADYLSDTYGFCMFGFSVEVK